MCILSSILSPHFQIPYLAFTFFISLYSYRMMEKYFNPVIIKNIDPNGKEDEQNLHDLYPEFRRYDKLSFIRLFLGYYFYFWVKIFLFVFMSGTLAFILKYICCYRPLSRLGDYISTVFVHLGILLMGVSVKNRKHNPKDLYKKYLGYSADESQYDSGYAYIVSNHISLVEVFYYIGHFWTGLIGKKTMLDYPFIGYIGARFDSLYLDRTSKDERDMMLDQIKERGDKFFYNREQIRPLTVFPEGTTSSGRHILQFKKGVFNPLKPVRPVVVINEGQTLAMGITSVSIYFMNFLTIPYHKIEFVELPVIRPTRYMFETYRKTNKEASEWEDWQIYAEVVREIFCEIGNFQKGEKNFRDSMDYISVIRGKKVKNT